MPSPTEMTLSQLSRLIGTPKAPVLVDVRIEEDFADDPHLIPGAFRHPFDDVATLVPGLANQRVVVICQKGKKLSQGAAAILGDVPGAVEIGGRRCLPGAYAPGANRKTGQRRCSRIEIRNEERKLRRFRW